MSNVNGESLQINNSVRYDQPNGDPIDPNTLQCKAELRCRFQNGTTEGAFDRGVNTQLTIVTSGTMVVDLYGGTYSDGTNAGNLVDKNGAQVTLTKLQVVDIGVVSETGGATAMYVNPAATSAMTALGGILTAKGNGSGFGGQDGLNGRLTWCDPNGQPVTATKRYLQIVNSSAVVGHVNVMVCGTH